MSSRIPAVAVLVVLSVALAGCGKKGDPEFPQGTQTETVKRDGAKDKKEPVKPKRPFVLDGLLN